MLRPTGRFWSTDTQHMARLPYYEDELVETSHGNSWLACVKQLRARPAPGHALFFITVLMEADRVLLAVEQLDLPNEIAPFGPGHEQHAQRGTTPPIQLDDHHAVLSQAEVVEEVDP